MIDLRQIVHGDLAGGTAYGCNKFRNRYVGFYNFSVSDRNTPMYFNNNFTENADLGLLYDKMFSILCQAKVFNSFSAEYSVIPNILPRKYRG